MTWRYDVMSSQKYMNDNIFEINNQLNYGNIKRIIILTHTQAEIDEADFVTSWHDVMTWRHDMTTSCKWKIVDSFELSYPKIHGNKK